MGNINEFLTQQNFNNLREAEKKTITAIPENESTKNNYLQSKKTEKELKQQKNKLNKLEKEIAQLEDEIKIIEHQLSYHLVDLSPDFFTQYQTKKEQLEQLMEDWTLLAD